MRKLLRPRLTTARSLSALLTLALSLSSLPLAAEDTTTAARTHFSRGYELANAGDYEAAIVEFEQAYALSPNFSVLFNLGQAHAAAGRASKAVQILRRYLELGGASLAPAQRRDVAQLMERYQRRIGRLSLQIEPAGAQVMLDGVLLGAAPLSGPVEADMGTHGLAVTAEGHAAYVRNLQVVAGQTMSLSVRLQRLPGTAALELGCELPDVQVSVDGKARGKTPLRGSLLLATGAHDVVMSRVGYLEKRLSFQLSPGESRVVDCQLERDPSTTGLATLQVEHPVGTRASVDGVAFTGQRLAPGRHVVGVTGPGYEAARRELTLSPSSSLRVNLVPRRSSQELDARLRGRGQTQRTVAYVVGGAALVSGGVAAALVVSNGARYEDWREQSQRFLSASSELSGEEAARELDQLLRDENSIRNRDALALGFGVASGVLLLGSAALYFTAEPSSPRLTISARELSYRATW